MTTTTAREQVLTTAEELARTFAGRAAEHDRDATFPHDNYADLAAAGLLRMSLPGELGGAGAGLPEVVGVLERIASGPGRSCRWAAPRRAGSWGPPSWASRSLRWRRSPPGTDQHGAHVGLLEVPDGFS